MQAMVIIDIQNGLMNKKIFEKELFIQNINKAIIENRKNNNVIIFIQHNSESLKNGTNNWQIHSELIRNENDVIIQKKHGDAFNDTQLIKYLLENNVSDIIICGLVSHGCVFHTCKSGIENGFNVKLLKNGHSNWLKNAKEKICEVNEELEKTGVKIV